MEYLQEHYKDYKGPRRFACIPRGIMSLMREMSRGNAPPAPYNRGIAENLNVFFYAAKPYAYRQQGENSEAQV